MAILPVDLDRLNECDVYRNHPLQSAIDAGWTQWWAQVQHMTRTAADMAVWEISHAMEHFFEVYASEKLDLRVCFRQARDGDPQGNYMEMLVNGRFYQGSGYTEIETNLHDRLLAIDGGQALEYVHKVASRSILSNRKVIADRLAEAFPVSFHSASQAMAVRSDFAPQIQALAEYILLQGSAPHPERLSPRPRM